MGCIIEWLNVNQGAVIILLTFAYVITTVLILSSNKKQRKQDSNIQKQNVNIQLFERRFTLYNDLKENLEEKYNSIENPYGLLKYVLDGKYDSKKIELNVLRAKYLFSNESCNQLIEIEEKIKEISSIRHDMRYLIDYIKVNDQDFYNRIKSFIEDECNDRIDAAKEKEFENISRKKEWEDENPPGVAKKYNYYKMQKDADELLSIINKRKALLFEQFEKEMSVEDVGKE